MQSQPSKQQQFEKKEENQTKDQRQKPDQKPKDKPKFDPAFMILRMQTGLDGLNFQNDYLNNQQISDFQRRISEGIQQ